MFFKNFTWSTWVFAFLCVTPIMSLLMTYHEVHIPFSKHLPGNIPFTKKLPNSVHRLSEWNRDENVTEDCLELQPTRPTLQPTRPTLQPTRPTLQPTRPALQLTKGSHYKPNKNIVRFVEESEIKIHQHTPTSDINSEQSSKVIDKGNEENSFCEVQSSPRLKLQQSFRRLIPEKSFRNLKEDVAVPLSKTMRKICGSLFRGYNGFFLQAYESECKTIGGRLTILGIGCLFSDRK